MIMTPLDIFIKTALNPYQAGLEREEYRKGPLGFLAPNLPPVSKPSGQPPQQDAPTPDEIPDPGLRYSRTPTRTKEDYINPYDEPPEFWFMSPEHHQRRAVARRAAPPPSPVGPYASGYKFPSSGDVAAVAPIRLPMDTIEGRIPEYRRHPQRQTTLQMPIRQVAVRPERHRIQNPYATARIERPWLRPLRKPLDLDDPHANIKATEPVSDVRNPYAGSPIATQTAPSQYSGVEFAPGAMEEYDRSRDAEAAAAMRQVEASRVRRLQAQDIISRIERIKRISGR